VLESHALDNRPLESFESSFILPCRFSSSEYLCFRFRPKFAFRRGHYLPRFLSPSRHHQRVSTSREGFQCLATFRPQIFSISRRFTPLTGFVGLFHPTATYAILPVQGFLSLRSTSSSPEDVAPMPFQLKRSPTEVNGRALRPRLRGFSQRRVALLQFGVNRPAARSPHRVRVSSRLLTLLDSGLSLPETVRL
jgi:hypothetical protein